MKQAIRKAGATRCSVEVDQSGKVEQTDADTVLALSNGERYAIRIPATVKREVLRQLREEQAPGKSRKALPLRVFAAGLYLLLKDHLQGLDRITVDTEYVGQDASIRGMLLDIIRESLPDYSSDHIVFGFVGKDSPSHDLAWKVYKGKRQPDHIVTKEELSNLL